MKSTPKPKTVRFDALVKNSGQPVPVTLWTKPEDDDNFMRAVREHRVVTLIMTNVGTKKDFGIVGFTTRPNAAYLIFPRRIEDPADTKVIGIKYDQLATEAPKGPVYKPRPSTRLGIPMRERPRFQIDEESATTKTKETAPDKSHERIKREAKPPRARDQLASFSATVTLTTKQSMTLTTQAKSKAEAEKLFRKQASELEPELAKAKLERKLGPVRKQT